MYTRWRLYILGLFLLLTGTLLLAVHLIRKRGVPFSHFQAVLLIAGCLLTAETLIVSTLSNFNLGVILPAVFGAPLILLAFLLPSMKAGALPLLKWLYIAAYSAAGILFLVCGICMLTAAHSVENAEDEDFLIVLGAAVHGDKVTWVLENRLNTAADYLNRHPETVCIVSGGQGSGETVPEGRAMKRYLEELGIPGERILSEEKASSTIENFRYSRQIMDTFPISSPSVAFITTDFHVFRAGRVAAAAGMDAYGIAAPDVWYLRLNNFMRECVGICVYAIRGNFS